MSEAHLEPLSMSTEANLDPYELPKSIRYMKPLSVVFFVILWTFASLLFGKAAAALFPLLFVPMGLVLFWWHRHSLSRWLPVEVVLFPFWITSFAGTLLAVIGELIVQLLAALILLRGDSAKLIEKIQQNMTDPESAGKPLEGFTPSFGFWAFWFVVAVYYLGAGLCEEIVKGMWTYRTRSKVDIAMYRATRNGTLPAIPSMPQTAHNHHEDDDDIPPSPEVSSQIWDEANAERVSIARMRARAAVSATLLTAVAAGCGFSTLENIGYTFMGLASGKQVAFSTAVESTALQLLIRVIGATPVHCVWAWIVGDGIARRYVLGIQHWKWWKILIVPILLHGTDDFVQFVIVGAQFVGLLENTDNTTLEVLIFVFVGVMAGISFLIAWMRWKSMKGILADFGEGLFVVAREGSHTTTHTLPAPRVGGYSQL